MKLVRAEFQNFRLLRDLTLEFSTDSKKKLTVIRAENETGKTTILNGLQWALYGDEVLQPKGRKSKNYRIHPIDWDVSSHGNRIPISVQVDFETTASRTIHGKLTQVKEKYRIIRSTYETIIEDNRSERSQSTVKLFHFTNTGCKSIKEPEVQIQDKLPHELREVFFTDGDRALSFIEVTVSQTTKRERVLKAIRSLLGLEVIEDAIKHVDKSALKTNKKVKEIGSSEDLKEVAIRLEGVNQDFEELKGRIKDTKSQFTTIERELANLQSKINEALVKGNRDELKSDIEKAKSRLKQINHQCSNAEKEHSNLFRRLSFSRDIMRPVLEKAFEKLRKLHQQGEIPNTTIPVLEERLKSSTCFCGESLDSSDTGGEHRRKHIQHLISEARNADTLKNTLTDLYFGSISLGRDKTRNGDEEWLVEYEKVVERRDGLERIKQNQEGQLKALEIKLDKIPDTDIKGLRHTERVYLDQRDRFNGERIRFEAQLETLEKEKSELELQRHKLLKEEEKGARIQAEFQVVQDVRRILNNSYERITNEELTKVSELMNDFFLEMIGADTKQRAIIRKSEISKDFDIVVYGPNGRMLSPELDLNGASRRALTLSFILALTKVSEVEAPNVIDTPLGMMSGYVKKSVLKTAIRESSQIVLFLTRSEIADCEEILDTEAGCIVTLTNPAHYPKMLINDPDVNEHKVVKCECTHRKECSLCKRRVT